MATGYEEISNHYASREIMQTDSKLSQDSNMLGGIPAEDYATKQYVLQISERNSKEDRDYTNEKIKQIKQELKSYSDISIDNIDFSNYATKTDLNSKTKYTLNSANNYTDVSIEKLNINKYATQKQLHEELENANSFINKSILELNQYLSNKLQKLEKQEREDIEQVIERINNEIMNLRLNTNERIKTLYASDIKLNNQNFISSNVNNALSELFISVSSGKLKIASAITGKGVNASSKDNFDTLASKIREIKTAGGSGGSGGDGGGGSGEHICPDPVTPIYKEVMGEFEMYHYSGGGATDNKIAYTQDGRYAAVYKNENNVKKICVFGVDTRAFYRPADSKYEYTFEELKIPSDALVYDIQFGAFGIGGYSKCCLLAIGIRSFNPQTVNRVYVFTFGAYGNGELLWNSNGKFDTSFYVDTVSNSSYETPSMIAFAKNNPYVFAFWTKDARLW